MSCLQGDVLLLALHERDAEHFLDSHVALRGAVVAYTTDRAAERKVEGRRLLAVYETPDAVFGAHWHRVRETAHRLLVFSNAPAPSMRP